jgi:small conductance mechanosensitive channel
MKEWFNRYSTIKIESLVTLAISYAIKVVVAVILLIIGFWIINRFIKISDRILEARNFDMTFKRFIRNLAGIGLKVVLIITIFNFAGFRTTSVITLLGAAGLAVGLALQGTLTNFAGGVLLLLFKPFKVGDIIEAQGKKGMVDEIQLFTTVVKTEENKIIIIPNSMLSNGIIENHTYITPLPVDKETKQVLK